MCSLVSWTLPESTWLCAASPCETQNSSPLWAPTRKNNIRQTWESPKIQGHFLIIPFIPADQKLNLFCLNKSESDLNIFTKEECFEKI